MDTETYNLINFDSHKQTKVLMARRAAS